MAIGGPFRKLGRFLDECERGDREVTSVDIEECPRAERDFDLTADVEIRLRSGQFDESGRGLALESPRVGPDGTLRFALESVDSLVPSGEYGVAVDPTGGSIRPDGSIRVTLRATAGTSDDTADSITGRERRSSDAPTPGGSRSTGDPSNVTGDPSNSTGDPSNSTGDSSTDADSDAAVDETDPTDTVGKPGAPEGDRDVPPFKDPELLESIFEAHDTFAEMAEAIEMDVTAETVRRYMIDYDIHQPNSYETSGQSGEADDASHLESADRRPDGVDEAEPDRTREAGAPDRERVDSRPETPEEPLDQPEIATEPSAEEGGTPREPVVLSDGIGLPDDVTVETLIDTVKRSNTLYEVTRDIDVDRQEALEMLEELNLLDLVVGRLATEGERDIGRDDIVDRLRQASATA